jgi:hypothetical protein
MLRLTEQQSDPDLAFALVPAATLTEATTNRSSTGESVARLTVFAVVPGADGSKDESDEEVDVG